MRRIGVRRQGERDDIPLSPLPGAPARASAPAARDRPAFGGPAVVDSVAEVPAEIAAAFGHFLQPLPGAPDPSVIVLQVTDRSVGMGNLRGLDRVGPFSSVELRGGRVEAVVRVQVFAPLPAAVNDAVHALQGRLLAARSELFDAGVLELTGLDGTLPEEQSGAWVRTADYGVLFEYDLAPASPAEALIARIPIRAEQEFAGSAAETTTVTDDLVRWDEGDAPALVMRGRRTIGQLAVAAFTPAGTPTGTARVLRSHDGAIGAPTAYTTWDDFVAAVGDPDTPDTHGELTFATLADFLSTFPATGSPFLLGDWEANGLPDGYDVGVAPLASPIHLPSVRDRFEISVDPAPLDRVAVVYVRAGSAIG